MTRFRNDSKGIRGILLAGGGHVFLSPGESKTVASDRIKAVPNGLVEVDEIAAQSAGALGEQPADLGKRAHKADAADPDADPVTITPGQHGAQIVNAPWLVQPETFADIDVAEARALELREAGPPEGWNPDEDNSGTGDHLDAAEDQQQSGGPLDRDGNGEPGGSKPHDPPSLSNMTKAQLIGQAGKEGVDVAAIQGTGQDGRVLADDIRAAIEARRTRGEAHDSDDS